MKLNLLSLSNTFSGKQSDKSKHTNPFDNELNSSTETDVDESKYIVYGALFDVVKDVFVQLCKKDNIKDDQIELNKNTIDDYLYKPSNLTKNVYKDTAPTDIKGLRATSIVGNLDLKTQSLILARNSCRNSFTGSSLSGT